MKGKELFADKNITLADGKSYKLEFSFDSLMELEDKFGGDFQAVFDMFEKNFNSRNLLLALWACLITHHEEFLTLSDEDIYKTMKKLVNAETYLVVKLATLECFGAFWNKAQTSKQIPEEYRKVLEEFNQKSNKKK